MIAWETVNDKKQKEILKQVDETLTEKAKQIPVTLREVYNEIGLEVPEYDDYYDRWGWTEKDGFHELTFKERYPYGCPCCGRPWTDGSE